MAPTDYTLILTRAALIPSRASNPATAGVLIDFLLSQTGRQALAREHLYLEAAEMRGEGLLDLEDGDSYLRPISLSPVLLAGLDQQRRAHFIALWRSTFSKH